MKSTLYIGKRLWYNIDDFDTITPSSYLCTVIQVLDDEAILVSTNGQMLTLDKDTKYMFSENPKFKVKQ